MKKIGILYDGSKNFNFWKLTYFSHKGHRNERFGKVS